MPLTPTPDSLPNWAEQWTCFGTWGLVITALVAGWIALRQIKQTRAIEHAQTFLDISRRWNDSLFREARIRIRKFYANKDPKEVTEKLLDLRRTREKEYWECIMTLDFFETMAMNIKHNSITLDMVDDVLGSVVCQYWAMLFDYVEHQREGEANDKYYVEFEKLANQIAEKNKYPKPWQCEESKDHEPKVTTK
jgi:Domain of unknown function (DUF4760)